ncbi:MAG: class I adenylate-forming enzyme family protein, partial [Hyphomicrobiaceae bacterium]
TRLTPDLIRNFTEAGYWGEQTFFDLFSDRVAAHPDRECLVDARERLTYAQLNDKILQTAAFLKAQGIGRGDVVTIQLPNRVEFAYVFFALELLGAIANKINPDFRAREVKFVLQFAGSKGYVCASSFKGFDYVEMIGALRSELPILSMVCVVDAPGSHDTVSLLDGVGSFGPLPPEDRVRMDANEIFRIAFTSGTTGNPKCVMHSFNSTVPAARFNARDMLRTEADTTLIFLPLGLNWGYLELVETLLLGAKAVLLDRFSANGALDLIEREKVTVISTAPAAIISMLNEPELEAHDLSSLRLVITGGASCPEETLREYIARMPGRIIELYGMLETGYQSWTRFSDDPKVVNGTVGRCVEGMGLRLLDDDGNDVGRGEVGDIAAYGPSVCLGYYNNPVANADAFTADDWFRSGDLGEFSDEQGNVRIVGRSKEIINRGGKKFFPREVEEILYTHPKIMHAAMVGVKDLRLGERNCLCVIPRADQTVTLEEMIAFLKGEVSDYKLPERLEVVEELPFTATGKLQRFELTHRIEEQDRTKLQKR